MVRLAGDTGTTAPTRAVTNTGFCGNTPNQITVNVLDLIDLLLAFGTSCS